MNSKSAILYLNLHREFFAQTAAGMKRIGQGEPAPAPGVTKNYLDAKNIVAEDCIRSV